MHLLVLWHGLCMLVVLNQSVVCATEQFKLVGMFTITSVDSVAIREAYGVYPQEAARLAVQHVREEGLLAEHNYELQMLEFETTCDQIGAVIANLEFTRDQDSDPDTPYAIVGPVCSESTELLATIASQYLNIVQVSYGVLSPEFSDVEAYSYFYRTVPEFTAYVESITAILEYFDWQVIGIVLADNVRYGLLKESLARFFTAQNTSFRIATTLSIASHYRFEGRGLQDSVRIFVGMVDETMGADTLCAAYRSGLTGREFVWILMGDYYDGWWLHLQNVQCTEEEMLKAVESTIILSNTRRISHKYFRSIRGQNESEFWDDFSRRLKQNTGLDLDESRTPRVLQSYDAVWTIAEALDVTLMEGNFTSTVEDQATVNLFDSERVLRLHQALNQNMKKLSFKGAAGKIKFSDMFNSPQQPATSIFQMQNGSVTLIGIYEEFGFDFKFVESNFTWPNGEPPRDRPIVKVQVVSLWIILVVSILTVALLVYAVVVLVLNIVYRKHKVIKASSPYINILLISGGILALLAIPAVSIEHLDVDNIVSDSAYLFFCNIRAWLIHIAITLAFGSLFAKTWRVYLIFRNPWAKARPYKDHVLLCIVGVLLAIDIVILSLSTWRVPLTLNTYTFPSPTDKFVVNAYRMCLTGSDLFSPSTEYLVWLGAHSGLKLLLFLFGIFLVIQTSKIKAKFFQDSRYIGISIYVTVSIVGVGVPASFALLLSLQEDLSYVFLAGTLLLTTFFVLTLIFIPRFLLLTKYKHKVPTVVLVGLNPSFHVEKTLKKKKSAPRALLDNGIGTTTSTVSLIASPVASLPDSLPSVSSDDTVTEWELAYDEEPVSPTTAIAQANSCSIENPYVSFEHKLDSQCSISNGLSQCHPVGEDTSSSDITTTTVTMKVHCQSN